MRICIIVGIIILLLVIIIPSGELRNPLARWIMLTLFVYQWSPQDIIEWNEDLG